MVLLAVCIIAIVSMVGLAIDGTILGIHKKNQVDASSLLAIAAIKAYAEKSGAREVRFGYVEQRVNELLSLNKENLDLLGSEQVGSQRRNLLNVIAPDQGYGRNGRVVPVYWHVEEPVSGQSRQFAPDCPYVNNHFVGPCAEKLDPYATHVQPNGMLVELKSPDNSPLRSFFMEALGHEGIPVRSHAIAVQQAVNVLFLVDLSRFSSSETHARYETGNPLMGEQAYPLSEPGSCSSARTNRCVEAYNCSFPSRLSNGYYDESYEIVRSSRYLPGAEVVARLRATAKPPHFHTDYNCHNIVIQNVRTSLKEPRSYLIDSRQTASYYGAQPLTDMLHTVHGALTLLEGLPSHLVSVGFLGFDHDVEVANRRVKLDAPTSDELVRLKFATDKFNQIPEKLAMQFEKYMLFVREDAQENLPAALMEGLEMLRSNELISRKNIVIYIGDGMTTCTLDGACDSSYEGQLRSRTQALEIIRTEYAKNDIEFHMIQFGTDGNLPHSLLTPSELEPGECMDGTEMRAATPPLQQALSEQANPRRAYRKMYVGDDAYLGSSDLWKATYQTNGSTHAIRPCAEHPGGGGCRDISEELRTACKSQTAGSSSSGVPNPVIVPPFTDSAGRLLFDPTGRTRTQQGDAAVREILRNYNPFVLVQ